MLVGDADVIREYRAVMTELWSRIPTTMRGAAAWMLPLKASQLDPGAIQRVNALRARILKALDDQEERVLRDQPLAKLAPDEVAELGDIEPLMRAWEDKLSREAGRGRVPPKP